MGELKPLLRWAGSKQRLLPALVKRAPNVIERYFEPFAGSASLFFALRPKRATLSDINADLVNFYRRLKANPGYIYERMSTIPRNRDAYLRSRREYASETDLDDRAVLFWYLNRHCFNGLFRTNRIGKFNVPYGSKLPPLPSFAQVENCVRMLRCASIKKADFSVAISDAGPRDFIYVDPPYKRASVRNRGEYGPGAMPDSELTRLISTLKAASRRGTKILISYNCDLSEHLPGWKHDVINGRHLISADPAKRVRINEYTARNYGACVG